MITISHNIIVLNFQQHQWIKHKLSLQSIFNNLCTFIKIQPFILHCWCFSKCCCLRWNVGQESLWWRVTSHRYLVDSRSNEGTSSCWNVNKKELKMCILMNVHIIKSLCQPMSLFRQGLPAVCMRTPQSKHVFLITRGGMHNNVVD